MSCSVNILYLGSFFCASFLLISSICW